MENFITLSLETHLFFSRIMKEHSLFLEAGFPCINTEWIERADWFKCEFEKLLRETLEISNRRVNNDILKSDELVTEFTIPAEKRTEFLSGVSIDSRLSVAAQKLHSGCPQEESKQLVQTVQKINERAIWLLNGLIEFKESILANVEKGQLFTANYPLLIKHIIREAKLYRATVQELMQNKQPSYKNMCKTENFWNQIMMEHALFIRGLLDPSEEQLIATADGFAADYKKLLSLAKQQDCRAMDELSKKSLAETIKLQEFKTAGAEGILNCKIASIILPLLADHVLREANHYIRILKCGSSN